MPPGTVSPHPMNGYCWVPRWLEGLKPLSRQRTGTQATGPRPSRQAPNSGLQNSLLTLRPDHPTLPGQSKLNDMRVRKQLNRILKPLLGYQISKVEFGRELWPDVKTLLAKKDITTVFDVGANEGQTAVEFLRHFPRARIYSFEPAPAAFQTLRAFAASHPRVTAVNTALGHLPGPAEFHENAFAQASSFLPAAARSGDYFGPEVLGCRRKITVEVTTLDAFCRSEAIGTLDLLKLDVQGFELNVLKGAAGFLAAGNIGCLVLELNFAPLYEGQAAFQDVAGLLGSHRYDLTGFYDFNHTRQNHLQWCEAVFHRRH